MFTGEMWSFDVKSIEIIETLCRTIVGRNKIRRSITLLPGNVGKESTTCRIESLTVDLGFRLHPGL